MSPKHIPELWTLYCGHHVWRGTTSAWATWSIHNV